MRLTSKRYLRMQIQLDSSLSIGSGENINTDHDILRDAQGQPYIPGTAVAGVTRHALVEARLLERAEAEIVFGNVNINHKAGSDDVESAVESCIVTYDIHLQAAPGKTHIISNRDMVRLDDYKTAMDGLKFDMEVLEPGAIGTVIIEENRPQRTEDNEGRYVAGKDPLELIAQLWQSGAIRFGAKTTRGYGMIRVTNIQKAEFHFVRKDGSVDKNRMRDWIAFDPQLPGDAGWEPWPIKEIAGNEIRLVLDLQQIGGLSIRRYMTDKRFLPDKKARNNANRTPDYGPMTYASGAPVIPGTTWAGAFRHAMRGFLQDENAIKAMYGDVAGNDKVRSSIYFSESAVRQSPDVKDLILTRVAIDRLTGGAKPGALYTEKIAYGGTTQLTIVLKRNAKGNTESFCNALAASVVDLHEGFLAIGGETSIGRGLFAVTKVNGQPVSGDAMDLYTQVCKVLRGED